MASTGLENTKGVDPVDVPSAQWGWSGESISTFRVAGWFFTGFLLLMLIGNHSGHVEDYFLLAFAALLVYFQVSDIVKRRKGSRR
ncbi:MAG: DUF2631 domain-containing protein [Mycobacteriaceae bacterium]